MRRSLLAGILIFVLCPTAFAQSASRVVPADIAERAEAIVEQAERAKGDDRGEFTEFMGDNLRGRQAFDFNPDPEIVEVVIVAFPHRVRLAKTGPKTQAWTYNGTVPGPQIDAEVGNTLIVHFVNLLPEETTVHWHGVELPALMDGTPLSQLPVPSGGYFRYEFPLTRAALYWYHPHFNTAQQIEKGLQGALVVRDPAEDALLDLPTFDHVLVLDDVLLDDRNQIVSPGSDDPLENAARQLNGREGNVMLVGGREGRKARVRKGVPYRFRIVNTSNSRFMRISIEDHTMWKIGSDAGLLQAPIAIEPIQGSDDLSPDRGIILTPGERADIVFTPQGNRSFDLKWYDWERGRHITFYMDNGNIGIGDAEDDGAREPQTLLTFRPVGHDNGAEFVPPASLRDITPINVEGARPLMSMFGHTPPDAQGDVTFFVQMKDGMPLPFPMVTPEDAPTAEVGETVIWNVVNMTGGDHNFHLHGFFFQPLEVEYVDMDNPANNYTEPFPYLEEKDTVRLPKRTGARMRSRTITRVAVRFDDTGREGQITASGGMTAEEGTSGGWMFHCHINEHSGRGMMSYLQVVDSMMAEGPEAFSRAGATPGTFELAQNYPNPLTGTTAIQFSLPEQADVSLQVYDVLGRRVATLLEGVQEPGVHEVQWDASDLPSGTYLYRLTAGSNQASRQLVIQR